MSNSLAENFPLYWWNKPKGHSHYFSGFSNLVNIFNIKSLRKQTESSFTVAQKWQATCKSQKVQGFSLKTYQKVQILVQFIQTIWTFKNADMGLLRTDTVVQFSLVSVSFYSRNATKPAFVLSLNCFLFGCFGFFLRLERSKWNQKRDSEAQIYAEAKCSGDFI